MTRLHDHPGDARKPERIAERFWASVNRDGPVPAHVPEIGPCWLWTGKVDTKDGYGKFDYRDPEGKRIHMRAHRFAYESAVGPIGAWCACHRCDNRLCVRHEHMFLGTRGDNRDDCVAKGRTAKGAQSGPVHQSALTENDVREIRTRAIGGEFYASIAPDFGIGRGQISRIVTGKRWGHVV